MFTVTAKLHSNMSWHLSWESHACTVLQYWGQASKPAKKYRNVARRGATISLDNMYSTWYSLNGKLPSRRDYFVRLKGEHVLWISQTTSCLSSKAVSECRIKSLEQETGPHMMSSLLSNLDRLQHATTWRTPDSQQYKAGPVWCLGEIHFHITVLKSLPMAQFLRIANNSSCANCANW